MKQQSLGLKLDTRRTRKRQFLDEMEVVVPWKALLSEIEPHCRRASTGRPPFAVETMLRIHLLQQWFNLSDLAAEEALYDVPAYRSFVGLADLDVVPDETSILRFRRLLETHDLAAKMFDAVNILLAHKGLMLREGSAVDATIIAAPSSTKNQTGERDPEMHQTKKGQQWYFGMKAHVGTDLGTGLVHSIVSTAANVADVTQSDGLVRDSDKDVYADSGYQAAEKYTKKNAKWHVAMRPGKRRQLDKSEPLGQMMEDLERIKAQLRAKAEHAFRVIKQQFGFTKVRYKGIHKNHAKLNTLFMLSNLWMVRKTPQACGGWCA